MEKRNHITTTVGKNFKISRKYNSGTGYEWDILLSPTLTLVDTEHKNSLNMPGSPGVQIWTIKSNQKGDAAIVLWYHRRWEAYNPSDAEIITVETVSRQKITHLDLYFSGNNIVGYMYNNKFYNSQGIITRKPSSLRNIVPIKIKDYEDDVESLSFYYLDNELVYNVHETYNIYDGMFCLSNRQGKVIGCPSGGITGKGDGRLSNFQNSKVDLGTIKFPPRI